MDAGSLAGREQPGADGGLRAWQEVWIAQGQGKSPPSLRYSIFIHSVGEGGSFIHEGRSVKFIRYGGDDMQGAGRQAVCKYASFHLKAST